MITKIKNIQIARAFLLSGGIVTLLLAVSISLARNPNFQAISTAHLLTAVRALAAAGFALNLAAAIASLVLKQGRLFPSALSITASAFAAAAGIHYFGIPVLQAAVPAWLAFLLALVSLGASASAASLYMYLQATPKLSLASLARSGYARLSMLAVGFGLGVVLTGAAVREQGGAACTSWPLCNGWSVTLTSLQWLETAHRFFVAGVVIVLLVLLARAWREHRHNPALLTSITAAAGLYLSQAVMGGVQAGRGYPADLLSLHSGASAAAWAALVIHASLALFTSRGVEVVDPALPAFTFRQRMKDFLILTKPIIVLLLLVTTYAGMVVGGRGIPSLGLTFWTLLAGAFAAGGSGAINQYIDREIDGNMQRTARRPLPAGRMTPAEGLAFGVGLLVTGFFIMAAFANLLAALLSLAGMVYYILLYSVFLKRATVQNIVIGGGAGAIPPLVGWAAASGSLTIPAAFLFAIVFLWTPPHFWALALVRRKDYARAGIPMLPVVRGEKATRVQILVYTLELVALTLLMPVFHLTGSLFLISAVVLGGALIYSAWRVYKKGGNKTAWMMYRYSSMYLAFIFVALVLDVLI